eukprot:15521895-Heterocapsa_arctica.AAC.1
MRQWRPRDRVKTPRPEGSRESCRVRTAVLCRLAVLVPGNRGSHRLGPSYETRRPDADRSRWRDEGLVRHLRAGEAAE